MPAARHTEDLALVARVLAGDAAAWEEFVERYAGLILAMARRFLRAGDQDDIRTIFVDVLASLRSRRLRTYEGRSSLSTWLTLVTRSEVMEHLRHRFGRGSASRLLKQLSPAEQTLFRLYYVEGVPHEEVIARLSEAGEAWSVDRFLAALHHIERALGSRWLRRIAYDLHAQSVGAASGRMLEYLDHVRDEFGQHSGAFSPEYHLMERDARRTADLLRASVLDLRPRDRRLVELRFERGWSAREIASELGMRGQRSVYKAVERIVSKLRRRLRGSELT